MEQYKVSLATLIKELVLEPVFIPQGEKGDAEKIFISTSEIHRPALQLADYYECFDSKRIQVLGREEGTYLARMCAEKRKIVIDKLFATGVPVVFLAHKIEIYPEIIEAAEKYQIPVYKFEDSTSELTYALVSALNVHLAPRLTMHGILIEVYGEGILMIGDSGVGKSETAMELLKRGHRLIADDAVEIKRVSNKTLVGSAPEMIKYLIELRGIGLVDVRRIFGMGAVKETEKVDLVVQLEPWSSEKQYERLGMDDNYYEILGLKKPTVTIPIRPGRNLAIIIEVAAMNNRQRRMGYNAAEELNKRLMKSMGISID